MFRLHYLPGSYVVALGVGLLLGGWTQAESAGAQPSYLNGSDIAKALSDPQDAAMIDFVARRLPGNENVWYVLVLRARSSNAKNYEFVLASGKTAAAVQIVEFLKQNPNIARNPQSYSRWLYLERRPNGRVAALRFQAVRNYALRTGY